ncbi:MAG: hypothetical protein LUC34_06265 [Campylobacter sp.]|nr:hypothetical protein [Campylobacter sp.]
MDLFFKKEKSKKSTQQKIIVISPNKENIQTISEILVLKGYENIVKINEDFLSVQAQKVNFEDIIAVIVDIWASDNVSEYSKNINRIFAKDVIKIVLSKSDSIKTNQYFANNGIIFLNWDYQFHDLALKIEQNYESSHNNAIKVGILGCKGGVGNSLIAYNIAKNIYQRYLSPTLLVQGINSSFTADYYCGKSFEKEFFNNTLSFFKESKEDGYDFLNEKFKNFNFLIFDHSVHSLSKEETENVLNNIDCSVLVFDQNPTSIRKAKEICKINDFLVSVNQGVKRFFLCLNNPSNTKRILNDDSLNEVLSTKVDVEIPFKSLDLLKLNAPSPRKIENKIDELTDKLVGANNANYGVLKKIFGKKL